MSRHVSYRGATIDMEAMARANESVTALGNMPVNAKGDQLGKGGIITRPADQVARDSHGVKSATIRTGLKGAIPNAVAPTAEKKVSNVKEVELPSGDIIIGDSDES